MDVKDRSAGGPSLVFWELTRQCNLSCRHCRAVPVQYASPSDLGTAEAKGFIDSLSGFASPILVLTGGEPLFRSDVLELAAHASGRGLRVALATNGTLVTRELARRIKESGIQRVSISIDGSNARTHDSFRGIPGSFDLALEGFGNLKELGVSTQFNTTISRHNRGEVEDILKLAESQGADALHIFMLVPVGCGLQMSSDEMLSPEEYEEVLNWLWTMSGRMKVHLRATCAPHYYRIMRQRAKGEGRPAKHKSHGMEAVTRGCLAGSGVCFVSHEGKVRPCGYLPLEAGDIRTEEFGRIWNESALFQSLRDTDKLKGKCGRCEYRRICSGCRARAYGTTGDYLGEEPYCVYEPGG